VLLLLLQLLLQLAPVSLQAGVLLLQLRQLCGHHQRLLRRGRPALWQRSWMGVGCSSWLSQNNATALETQAHATAA
jgi:hypothetical protein